MTLKRNMGQSRSSTFAIALLLFVASTATIVSKLQMCLSLLLQRVGYTHPSILGSSLDSQDPFLIHLCGVEQDLPRTAAEILLARVPCAQCHTAPGVLSAQRDHTSHEYPCLCLKDLKQKRSIKFTMRIYKILGRRDQLEGPLAVGLVRDAGDYLSIR